MVRPEVPDALCREQEFYLLGLVYDGVHDAGALFERWCAVYPAHRGGGRPCFDNMIRRMRSEGKVVAVLDGDRVLRLTAPVHP